MPIEVLMPALSPTMEEGTLAKWTVKPGDSVSSGDVIAEIETDKATMEVEAVEEGTVGKLLVEEGAEGVKVNAPIALLLEEGEDDSALDGYEPGGAAKTDDTTPADKPDASNDEIDTGVDGAKPDSTPAPPQKRKQAEGDSVDTAPLRAAETQAG